MEEEEEEEEQPDAGPCPELDLPGLEPPPQPRRCNCPECSRPLPVCLCHVIPSPPIPTRTRVIILQHPHESRHPLSTVPVLARCLLNATVLVHRRLTTESLLATVPASSKFLYLFPPSADEPSLALSRLRSSDLFRSPPVVIAFDATWKHAKEMVRASKACLREVSGFRVCLDGEYREGIEGGSMYDGKETLVMRKEPREGYVTTMEAVARVLGAVEEGGGEIEGRLVGVLREMVGARKGFVKPMRPRIKMVKKTMVNRVEARATPGHPDHRPTREP